MYKGGGEGRSNGRQWEHEHGESFPRPVPEAGSCHPNPNDESSQLLAHATSTEVSAPVWVL